MIPVLKRKLLPDLSSSAISAVSRIDCTIPPLIKNAENTIVMPTNVNKVIIAFMSI